MPNIQKTYFFRDHPIVGLTIAHGHAEIMQVTQTKQASTIVAYGSTSFDPAAIENGVIVQPEQVAAALQKLIETRMQGSISTKRLALSMPSMMTFSRIVTLPKLSDEEIRESVSLEVEQYTPIAIDKLYVDYTVIQTTENGVEVLTVAAVKDAVDSYLEVARLLQLEPVLIETKVDSVRRLFARTEKGKSPTMLLDFDANMVDISIVERDLIATSSVSISPSLKSQIAEALTTNLKFDETNANQQNPDNVSELTTFIKEIRRMIRFYEERYNQTRHIEHIVLIGEDAPIMDFATLLTDRLRLPVHSVDLWRTLRFDTHLTPIAIQDRSKYITVAGLASANYRELFS